MSQQVRHWYISRDGHQYGPFTNEELEKRVELSHLQPTDLLWRPGLPGWRPANELFPKQRKNSVQPASATKEPADSRLRVGKVVKRGAATSVLNDAAYGGLEEQSASWRRRIVRTTVALICSAAVGAISGYVFRHFTN
jgi:hypothetical protein